MLMGEFVLVRVCFCLMCSLMNCFMCVRVCGLVFIVVGLCLVWCIVLVIEVLLMFVSVWVWLVFSVLVSRCEFV